MQRGMGRDPGPLEIPCPLHSRPRFTYEPGLRKEQESEGRPDREARGEWKKRWAERKVRVRDVESKTEQKREGSRDSNGMGQRTRTRY